MFLSSLPIDAFVDPFGQNRAVIEPLLQTVTAQILDYLTMAATASPLPKVDLSGFSTIPEEPTGIQQVLGQLQSIMAQSMNPAHPGYLGHMDPMPTTVSIIGDWVAAALNNNMLSVEMSPALSRLERQVMAELAQLFGLGEKAGGVLASGGTLANLQALAVARNLKLGSLQRGIWGQEHRPVIFASEIAHTSIKKAAMLLGLGTDGVIPVPTNGQARLDPEALESLIRHAQQSGQLPFAVVATAGTTVTGNIDPLSAIAQIAWQYDLWFHVDAAYGGAIAFSPTQRYRLTGIEQADSVTFNPQKWLYVTKTCASVMFRDLSWLYGQFQVVAPYMNTDDDLPNLGEISVQGTRHADILKLWLSLQHLGKRSYADLIDSSYILTAHFVSEVRTRPYLQLASQPEMNLVCFRGRPDWLRSEQWDQWNLELQQFLLDRYQTFLSLPQFRGGRWLKAVLLNPYTTPADITRLFEGIDRFVGGDGDDD